MKLLTKNKLIKELSLFSLFCSGRTFTETELKNLGTFKYDLGKYNPILRDINETPKMPIWYELRTDKNGKYLQLMTFNKTSVQLDKIWQCFIDRT